MSLVIIDYYIVFETELLAGLRLPTHIRASPGPLTIYAHLTVENHTLSTQIIKDPCPWEPLFKWCTQCTTMAWIGNPAPYTLTQAQLTL